MVFSDMRHNLCPASHFFLRVYLTFKYKLQQYYFEEKKLSATKHCTFVKLQLNIDKKNDLGHD